MPPEPGSTDGKPKPPGDSTDSSIDKPPQALLFWAAAAGGLAGGLVGALLGTAIG